MKQSILLSGIALTLCFVAACSNDGNDKEKLVLEYETQIKEKNIEISKLKEELILISNELKKERKNREELQLFDHKSRNIMRHIANKDFDKLRNEFDVDHEVLDGKIYFGELSNSPIESYFPTEIAEFPMYYKFYNPQPEFTEVGYFLYGYDQYGSERKYDIHFRFGKNNEFMYVATE
ncbi:hypothetical protein ACLM5H_25745 [Fredinandcohnia humi]